MNPLIQKYLQEKYGENYEQDAQKQYDEQVERSNTGNLFANIGDAIAGKSIGSSNEYFNQVNKKAKEDTIGKIENSKKEFMADKTFENEQIQADLKTRLSDPNSQESKNFRKAIEATSPDFAKVYGDDWNLVSAADKENVFNPLKFKEERESRKQQAAILAGQRKDAAEQREHERLMKQAERDETLMTSFGKARTVEDAKDIKAAAEIKRGFDEKLQELIDMREQAGGGQVFDRNAVGRAEQLAKDLLLDYKSLSKLGVLSQSDMGILNSIIPQDPTQFRSFWETMTGQDSTLSKMKKFKTDKNKEFNSLLTERLRNPSLGIAKNQSQQQTPGADTVKIKDPKGIVRIIPKSQAQAAIEAGGVLIESVAGR